MKLKIKITKEILHKTKYCRVDEGVYKNCAVAIAVRDIFPEAEVGTTFITTNIKNESTGHFNHLIKLPQSAQEFIQIFDEYGRQGKFLHRINMHEHEFEIDVPESVIESIGIEEVKQILSSSKTLELVG